MFDDSPVFEIFLTFLVLFTIFLLGWYVSDQFHYEKQLTKAISKIEKYCDDSDFVKSIDMTLKNGEVVYEVKCNSKY